MERTPGTTATGSAPGGGGQGRVTCAGAGAGAGRGQVHARQFGIASASRLTPAPKSQAAPGVGTVH